MPHNECKMMCLSIEESQPHEEKQFYIILYTMDGTSHKRLEHIEIGTGNVQHLSWLTMFW